MRRLIAPLSALLALIPALLPAPAASGDSAPDVGRPWTPRPISRPLYGIQPPTDDNGQRTFVQAADGVGLFIETWLPAPKARRVPPRRVPTVLVMTPYATRGEDVYPPVPENNAWSAIEELVPRGYAVAQAHVRGTGESGGCIEQTGPKQIDDGARVIEYLGREAPWTTGSVGMYGLSYDAETQISVAGLGDPKRIRYLKAIVPASTVAGQYEYSNFDGVPYAGKALITNGRYAVQWSLLGSRRAEQPAERLGCQPEILAASLDTSGDLTPYWRAREYRRGAPRVRAAMLMTHGLADTNVRPITAAGFFDRLPASTPKTAVFGQWHHEFPGETFNGVHPEWARADWLGMVVAWFDRYLKGLGTGVERWPVVQVQSTDGMWRSETEWPTTGGPVGHLALGPEGTLGVRRPSGSSTYRESAHRPPAAALGVPGDRAVFETETLRASLRITGQPALDTWVSLDRPDAHLAVLLEAVDAAGQPIEHAWTFGLRSMRHLEPLRDGTFAQQRGRAAAVGEPIHVVVRLQPTDLVAPAGGRLRITVAGSLSVGRGPEDAAGLPPLIGLASLPSGSFTEVTILHDCAHPSALRFLMPRKAPQLLNVRELDEKGPLRAVKGPIPVSDAGGLATAPVCGTKPTRLPMFGPAERGVR